MRSRSVGGTLSRSPPVRRLRVPDGRVHRHREPAGLTPARPAFTAARLQHRGPLPLDPHRPGPRGFDARPPTRRPILTDAFPREKRGFALGMNQAVRLVQACSSDWWREGLLADRGLAVGVLGQRARRGLRAPRRAYLRLRDRPGSRQGGRIDWWGNGTFAVGLGAVLGRPPPTASNPTGITPWAGRAPSWWACSSGAPCCWLSFIVIGTKIAQPLFQLSLFRIRAFTAGSLAGFAASIARGGLQFAHHLAAGDLAPAARLRLQPDAAVGRHLPAPPYRGLPRLGSVWPERCRTASAPEAWQRAAWLLFAGSFIGLMVLPMQLPPTGRSPC